jgi:hypothetical protein
MRFSFSLLGTEVFAVGVDRDEPADQTSPSRSIEAGQTIHLETSYGFRPLGSSSDVEAKR